MESERKLEKRLGVGRQRIREVINELEAEGLLVKYGGKGTFITPVVKSSYINLICSPTIKFNDPFYNRLLMETTNYCAKHAVVIVPITMETLESGRPDYPIIMIGKFIDEDIDLIHEQYSNLISLESYPDHEDLIQIYFDHKKIGYYASKSLQNYGHKKVIHLTGPDKYASSHYRKMGFLEGAQKYGLETLVIETKMNFNGGYQKAAQVIDLVQKENFTAVFAANDWMAIGLVQALKERNVRVPEKVSVLGVDDIPLASQFSPALTTFSLDARILIIECFSLIESMNKMESLGEHDNRLAGNYGKRLVLQPLLISRDTLTVPYGQVGQ